MTWDIFEISTISSSCWYYLPNTSIGPESKARDSSYVLINCDFIVEVRFNICYKKNKF